MPAEVARVESTLPAPVYNAIQLLWRRHDGGDLFVPIGSMQFQAAIGRTEILFVDGQGVEGRRLVRLACRPTPAQRDSLDAPLPCTMIEHFPDLKEVQMRLMSESPQVLERALAGQRQHALQGVERRVIPLQRQARRSSGRRPNAKE